MPLENSRREEEPWAHRFKTAAGLHRRYAELLQHTAKASVWCSSSSLGAMVTLFRPGESKVGKATDDLFISTFPLVGTTYHRSEAVNLWRAYLLQKPGRVRHLVSMIQ
jgi:hypothetical protein